jgi:hypothetical protein
VDGIRMLRRAWRVSACCAQPRATAALISKLYAHCNCTLFLYLMSVAIGVRPLDFCGAFGHGNAAGQSEPAARAGCRTAAWAAVGRNSHYGASAFSLSCPGARTLVRHGSLAHRGTNAFVCASLCLRV